MAFGQPPAEHLPHSALAQAVQTQADDASRSSTAATPLAKAAGQLLAGNPSADHGLIDGQPDLPDLPECLDVPLALSGRSAHWRTPPPPLAKDLTPPVLDGLQRPPRGLPAFA